MEHKYYDVLTIGMGPAGMAVSAMATEMGLRVCAVERNKTMAMFTKVDLLLKEGDTRFIAAWY